MCHAIFVWFLGMNVILSPPVQVPCPRRIIAEELLRRQSVPAPAPRIVDPFTVQLKEV